MTCQDPCLLGKYALKVICPARESTWRPDDHTGLFSSPGSRVKYYYDTQWTFLFIQLLLWAGKLMWIPRSDWLPKWATCDYRLTCLVFAASVLLEKSSLDHTDTINLLLAKLFGWNWLDRGLCLFLHFSYCYSWLILVHKSSIFSA